MTIRNKYSWNMLLNPNILSYTNASVFSTISLCHLFLVWWYLSECSLYQSWLARRDVLRRCGPCIWAPLLHSPGSASSDAAVIGKPCIELKYKLTHPRKLASMARLRNSEHCCCGEPIPWILRCPTARACMVTAVALQWWLSNRAATPWALPC